MSLRFYSGKCIWLLVCAALFALTHITNAWLFEHYSLSTHISWVYLPAFLRVAYVLILGPVFGGGAIFFGSLLLGAESEENTYQAWFNAVASALSPVLALGLFKLLKERKLQLNRISDLIQMCLLYALLNALVHHFCWAYLQPYLLISTTQLPIMVIGDLLGALLGACVFTWFMRRSGLYHVLERLSQNSPPKST
jgi:hypothetical protein